MQNRAQHDRPFIFDHKRLIGRRLRDGIAAHRRLIIMNLELCSGHGVSVLGMEAK
ncbi:MAG TPA: hypothetical protein VIJ78_12600 [Pseudolabrys sp.]|nr:hypothetical protein [Pseudolabrys sp.]